MLERPQLHHEASIRSYVAELQAYNEAAVPFLLGYDISNFEQFILRLHDASKGIGLDPGWVPHSTYFLLHEGEVVAVSNLRHALSPFLEKRGGHIGYGVRPSCRQRGFASELFRLTRLEAKGLGIDSLLMTCAESNLASRRIIEKSGGKLIDIIPVDAELVCRYQIEAVSKLPCF